MYSRYNVEKTFSSWSVLSKYLIFVVFGWFVGYDDRPWLQLLATQLCYAQQTFLPQY